MRVCGEIQNENRITQLFETDSPFFNGLSVLLATYDERARSSRLEFVLSEIHPTACERARKTFDLAAVYDNSFVEIFFPPDAASMGKRFQLDIWSVDAESGNAATVYLTTGEQRIAGHLSCRANGTVGAHDGIIAKLSYAPPTSEYSVPPNLEISLVSQCNLNCVHCISRETRKTVNHLDDRLRSQIEGWASDGKLHSAYTDFSGDVFWADSRFGNELDFFIGLDVPFHIDTNGTHVTRKALAKVFRSKVTSINVSIDAADAPTYARIRRGSPPLRKIFENMAMIKEVRDESGRTDVPLSASFVAMMSNIVELPRFIKRVADAGFDDVRTIHVQAHNREMIWESLWHYQELFNSVREQAIAAAEEASVRLFIDRAFEPHSEHEGTSLCRLPWNAAYVLANGDVLACCIPGLKMGNLHEESMEAIWNGAAYRELRRTVNSDERLDACRACPFNRKTNNPLSYMPILARREGGSRAGAVDKSVLASAMLAGKR